MRNFQAFSIKFPGLTDRIISDITIFPAFDPTNPPIVPLPHVDTRALWDTGATGSCISPGIAKTLGLKSVGMVNVNHAGGTGTSERYIVNLGLPHRVGFAGLLVHEVSEVAGKFSVILGMDVISRGDLAFTNANGESCFSFRMPSCAKIDYVEEWNSDRRIAEAKVGKDEPCPCGKKKPDGTVAKFKNCHGAVYA
ncbi:MAG: retroviral-like aspartic protease family protein [Thermoanaerobaculia bacterium]|jgi:hypothetical protein